MQKMARIVGELQRFQSPYSLVEVPEMQAYLSQELEGLKRGQDAQSLCASTLPPRARRPSSSSRAESRLVAPRRRPAVPHDRAPAGRSRLVFRRKHHQLAGQPSTSRHLQLAQLSRLGHRRRRPAPLGPSPPRSPRQRTLPFLSFLMLTSRRSHPHHHAVDLLSLFILLERRPSSLLRPRDAVAAVQGCCRPSLCEFPLFFLCCAASEPLQRGTDRVSADMPLTLTRREG